MLNKHIGWAAAGDYMQKFHRTSQTLQKEELNHAVCGDLYNRGRGLAVYLSDMREHFDRFEIRRLPKTCYQMLITKERRLVEKEEKTR